MNETFSRKELSLLVILFFSAIISFAFFLKYRTLAFPEHAMNFSINREEVQKKAEQLLKETGIPENEYKKTTIFSVNNQSKTYLERELGAEQTGKLADQGIDLWHFTTRFFKPLQEEEFSVSFLPDGRFVGYSRQIAASTPGGNLNSDEAQKVVENFLTTKAGLNFSDWKIVSTEKIQQAARVDHIMIFEKKDFKALDATYRLKIKVLGDQIGEYKEYLAIPEVWIRQYQLEISRNNLAQTVAETVVFIFFGLALLITFILQYRQNNLRLRFARWIGAITALIILLSSLNSLSSTFFYYLTTLSWPGFIFTQILISLLTAIFSGIMVMIIVASGEAIYRNIFPEKTAIKETFNKGLLTKNVTKGVFIGALTGVIFLTYEILYYFLGKKWGFWSPAEINYDNVFSTSLPWVYPLLLGFSAAVMEEGIFRLFGISFLKKYLKNECLAVIITSISWAFLHSNYPQTPWFVRGIELTFMGIILGILFLRYGIIASFTAHFTYNALLAAIALYSAKNLYISLSSTIVALLPFLIASGVFVLRTKKGFLSEDTLLKNKEVTALLLQEKNIEDGSFQDKKEIDIHADINIYSPLSSRKIISLIIVAVISGGLFLILHTQIYENFSDVLTVNRSSVLTLARSALQQKGIPVEEYQSVVTFQNTDISKSLAMSYVLEKAGFEKLKTIFPELTLRYWTVRFFKPLQENAYVVVVLPNGKVSQIIPVQSDQNSAANLSQNEAENVAKNYLIQNGYNFNQYSLVEQKSDKKEKRTDYQFVYEQKENKIADAAFRISLTIQGDQVTESSHYLKVPESWERQKGIQTTADFIASIISVIFGVAILILTFLTAFRVIKAKEVDFRSAFKIGTISVVFSVIEKFNSIPTFFNAYKTAIPIQTYFIQTLLPNLVGLIFQFFLVSFLSAIFIALWKDEVGPLIPKDSRLKLLYIRDGLISGYVFPLLLSTGTIVMTYIFISRNWLKEFNFPKLIALDTFFPGLEVITGLIPVFILAMVIGICLLVFHRYFKKWNRVLFIIIALILVGAVQGQQTIQDYFINVLRILPTLIIANAVIFFITRKNLLAYVFAIFISVLMLNGLNFFVQPDPFLHANGIVLLILALSPILVYIFYAMSLSASSSDKSSRITKNKTQLT